MRLQKTKTTAKKGSPEEEALKKQATRRNPEGYKKLAQYYIDAYRFEDAATALASYKKWEKTPSCAEEERLIETGSQMLLGVEKVVIIDSLVIDKTSFLQAYKLSNDAGKLYKSLDFFAAAKSGDTASDSGNAGNGQKADEDHFIDESAPTPEVKRMSFNPKPQQNTASSASGTEKAKADAEKPEPNAENAEGNTQKAKSAMKYEGTLFLTGLGKNVLYGQEGKIYSRISRLGEWSAPEELSATVNDSLCDYPFLCSDGLTLYFASTGHGSLGGYDLYVTRYNRETHDYYRPDNVGMPFNSLANDYMMAIDETSGLGWFASDRYQPEGKVCIYIFLPSENKNTYDIETTDEALLRSLARLSPIRNTQSGHTAELKKGQERLQKIRTEYGRKSIEKPAEFHLVINDERTYTSVLDFHSGTAAKKATEWKNLESKLEGLKQSLEKARDLYAAAPESQQKKLRLSILDMETQVRKLAESLYRMENEIRNLEQKALQ